MEIVEHPIDYSKINDCCSIDLSKLRDYIKPGALVLFTGLSVYSYSIEVLTHSSYSHCAMVVYPNRGGKTIITEASGKGVCLSMLDDYITDNDDKTIVIINPTFVITSEQIITIYEKYKNIPYTRNIFNLLSAVFRKELDPVDTKSFFCSEYVVTILSQLQVCILSRETNEYSPEDISKMELYDNNVMNVKVPPVGFFRKLYEFFKVF
jgi:hypothetical protein